MTLTPNMLTGGQAPTPQQSAMQLQLAALSYLHDQFAHLAAKPDLNFDDVANAAANLISRKAATADDVATQLSKVPREREKIRDWVRQKQTNALHHIDRLNQTNGWG